MIMKIAIRNVTLESDSNGHINGYSVIVDLGDILEGEWFESLDNAINFMIGLLINK